MAMAWKRGTQDSATRSSFWRFLTPCCRLWIAHEHQGDSQTKFRQRTERLKGSRRLNGLPENILRKAERRALILVYDHLDTGTRIQNIDKHSSFCEKKPKKAERKGK